MKFIVRFAAMLLWASMVSAAAQTVSKPPDSAGTYSAVAGRLLSTGLASCQAHALLKELVAAAPHRLSGSPGAARALNAGKAMMERLGFDNIRFEPVTVPHWVRGTTERAILLPGDRKKSIRLNICALGGSVATPGKGLTAEVVEVHSFEELGHMAERAKGKIVFFNRPMDPSVMNPMEAYGGAVNQRSAGAVWAARAGGVAALVRSVTMAHDRVPHTGSTGYADDTPKIPAAAISTDDADMLSAALRANPELRITIALDCQTLPDTLSANLMGEIRGSERPDEVVLVGSHIDSWDKGEGAHDDGAGCAQAIEVVRLIKELNLRPRRTIRAVLFINEENGNRGGAAYAVAPGRQREKHVAALESDEGAFSPRGFSVQSDSLTAAKITRWSPFFAPMMADRVVRGYSGVDITPIVKTGVPGVGLIVDAQRYFDYHHSGNDTVDKVHPREIELGAIAEALLCYLIAQEGL